VTPRRHPKASASQRTRCRVNLTGKLQRSKPAKNTECACLGHLERCSTPVRLTRYTVRSDALAFG
jgi:hypothetical protein